MQQQVKWLDQPETHDYRAAEDYLSLIMSPEQAAACVAKLSAAQSDIAHRKAKDILRASQPLVVADGYHRVCASYWIEENTDIPAS